MSRNPYAPDWDEMDALSKLQNDILRDPSRYVFDGAQHRDEHELLCSLLKSIDLNRIEEIIRKPSLTQEELDQILDKHQKWLDGKKNGKCADLSYMDLSCLDMSNRDLSYINFESSNLDFVNMTNVDAISANFDGASLYSPDVYSSCFYDSSFKNAKIGGIYPQDIAFYGAKFDSSVLVKHSLHKMTDSEIEAMKLRIKERKKAHHLENDKFR